MIPINWVKTSYRQIRVMLFTLFLLLSSFTLFAQPSVQYFSFAYEDTPLRVILEDLNQKYQLRFAYSSRFIPLDERLSAEAHQLALEEALERLFEEFPVTYRLIGQQIVLRPKKVEIEEITKAAPQKEIRPQTKVYQDERKIALAKARREKWEANLPYLQKKYISSIEGNRPMSEIDLEKYQLKPGDRYYNPVDDFFEERDSFRLANQDETDAYSRLSQVSIIPYFGTNTFSSFQITNEFSINLLWGMNGGVQGLEIGGIGNTIKNDVQGIQIAGVFNNVGDDLWGTQISGIGNFVTDTLQGLQVAGIFNISGYATAIQSATLFNIAKGDFDGIQTALLYNRIKGDANALQLSGLINHAGGNTKIQISGLANVAKNVKNAQISLLLNVADTVKGYQIGLINVSKNAEGLPLGLINLVKNGFNHPEFFGSEILYGNFAYKIGVAQFYNIFTIGARVDRIENDQSLSVQEMSWGLGYGIGTGVALNSRFLLHIEAVTMHINEKESWTSQLNQLNQLKVLLDARLGKRISLFAGPVGNLMVSRITDPQTGEIGTRLAPGNRPGKTQDGRNTKYWLGFNAGIRF